MFLIGHLRLQFLSLVDHLLYLADGRYATADMELCVDLLQLRLQVLGHTVTELLHGIHTSLLKQFRELGTYAVDTEQVSMVCPLQNQFLADAGCLCQLLAPLGSSAFLKQIGRASCRERVY